MIDSNVSIQTLDESTIMDIVHIHRSVLGYTISSKLGDNHLAHLYRHLARDPNSYVGVALLDKRPVGVISGAIDMDLARDLLFKSYPLSLLSKTIIKMIVNPSLIIEFWKNRSIDRPVFINKEPVPAILSTLAIHNDFQRLGLGKRLIAELEHFFTNQGINYYRLDTYITNQPARNFYKKMGFQEIEYRSNSVILIKGIQR